MKEWVNILKSVGRYGIAYVCLIYMYIFNEKMQWLDNKKIIEMLMQISIMLVIGYYIIDRMYVEKTENKNVHLEKMCVLVFILGIIMRVGYTMYTPWYERYHDIGNPVLEDAGHASYILHLYEGKLPSSNTYQFYHPPLYHILSAITMHITAFFTGKVNGTDVLEASKLVSCLAAVGTLSQIRKFLKELKIKQEACVLVMAIVAFLPNFYLLAGRINNDSLVVFFMILAIRYTYKWCGQQIYSNLIPLALAYGLGMMTKTSCGMLALFTGLWMLFVFYKKVKEKQWKTILMQFIVFGCISFPLGLWYQIRNLILFGQPLNYVQKIGKDSPTYIGMHSLLERLSPLGNDSFWDNTYNNPYGDYHLPSYLIKSAVFGEFTFEIEGFLPRLLLLCNLLLVIASLIAMVYIVIKGIKPRRLKWGLCFIWLIQMYSYIYFNIQFPNGCTMDFRYIVPTAVIGAIYLGMAWGQIKEQENIIVKALGKIVTIIVLVFSVTSIVMFCNIG